MYITYRDFTDVCPSAMMPDVGLFGMMGSYIGNAEARARRICTPDVYDGLFSGAEDVDTELLGAVRMFVCAGAYRDAVPHLDLVLTSTGFGVVSNQNVAPASADRVRALVAQLERMEMAGLDGMIDRLRHHGTWQDSGVSGFFVKSLFWKAEHMEHFGVASPTRADLASSMPRILASESTLPWFVSRGLYREMVRSEATGGTDGRMMSLVDMCRRYVAQHASGDGAASATRREIVAFLDCNLDYFQAYADSSAYRANHFEGYENKAEDSCYFFG